MAKKKAAGAKKSKKWFTNLSGDQVKNLNKLRPMVTGREAAQRIVVDKAGPGGFSISFKKGCAK